MIAQFTKRTKWLAAASVLVLCLAAGPARADDAALYTKTLQATGWIYVPDCGDATCWVVDREQRLVVTNKHVVGHKDDVEVIFPMVTDGKLETATTEYLKRGETVIIKGKVLSRDAKRDLALVKLEKLPDSVGVLTLAETSARPGESILSIGNSGLAGMPIENGTLWKVRTGKVSAKSFRVITYVNVNQKLEASLMNSNLHTGPGDSGGPVVNAKGELVGVTSGGNGGSSFAVDVTEVREFLAKALENGRRPAVSRPMLTGSWTGSHINNHGKKEFAGIKLRPDGTVLVEDEFRVYEGTYSVHGAQLEINVSALNWDVLTEIRWDDKDSFRITHGGAEFTMVRR